jgi:hypothetical protein
MLDFLTSAIRSAIGAAEAQAVRHSPLHETEELTTKLHEAIDAVHRAADSLERHVTVVESLAVSLTPLTESVTRLTDQIGTLLEFTAPIAVAEREVSRLEHLFGRRRSVPQPQPPTPPATDPGAQPR